MEFGGFYFLDRDKRGLAEEGLFVCLFFNGILLQIIYIFGLFYDL